MKRIPMIATRAMRYGTRRLRAGDAFEPTRDEARLLAAVGLAAEQPVSPRSQPSGKVVQFLQKPPQQAEMPPDIPEPEPEPEPEPAQDDQPALDELRARYASLSGKKADGRWGADRLTSEIEVLQ